MSVINNPLHKYTSYNYRWKFGLLSPGSIDNPEGYRENGPDVTIIQSGGTPDKSVTTFSEDALGVNVEYFIDDFRSEYLVVPNPGTSFSNAISFEFKIYEPYSVGLFFQTLKLAVTEAGYPSQRGYLDVPFLLELDFIGYDDNGNSFTGTQMGIPKHSLAIKLTNLTFNVDQSGATYTVTALPWNHQALLDQNQRIQTDFKIAGDTVEAMLQGSESSLVFELNKQQKELEQSQDGQPRARIAANRYKIVFPADAGQSQPNLNLRGFNLNGEADETGANVLNTSQELNNYLANDGGNLTGEELLFSQPVLRTSSATSSTDVNYIGQSQIITNFEDYGSNPFGIDQFVFDEGSDAAGDEVYKRGPLTIDANTREFQFAIGTKIEKIISQVILASDWGLSLINQTPDELGNIEWFKIHVESKLRDVQEMVNSGQLAFEFVYIVTPFKIDASAFAATWKDQNYTPKITDCVKSYQYLYTGLNMDIINFEFNIDNSFYKEVFRTNQGGADAAANAGSGVTVQPVETHISNNGTNDGTNTTDPGSSSRVQAGQNSTSGSGAVTSKNQVANLFSSAVLNSDIDMITLDLKLWGDPYYFMDTDVGNYRSPSGGNPNMTFDGKINPTSNEVYILIQFKSAVDYNGNLMQLDPVNLFSGIYKVVSFTNNFTNGMFTQDLNLMRMPNQEIESVENSNAVAEANASGQLPLILNNLKSQSASRAADFESLIKQAEDFQQLQTAFSQAGIQDFEKILNGTQIFDIAQNLGGAFNQLASLQNNLSSTLNALQGGLPNLLENAARNALGNTAVGQTINKVTNIRNNVDDIRNNLRGIF
jgi:hypothetical protein